MRVLLVYSNQSRELLPAPPIGMSYVASATRDAGHDVRFLDLNSAKAGLRSLADAAREFRPQVVGFSVRNIDNVVRQRFEGHLTKLAGQIDTVRAAARGAGVEQLRVVVGGPAISILGGLALEHLQADFAIVGEGEQSFPELLAALGEGRSVDDIPGVCVRLGETVTCNPPRHLSRFGASGLPDWIDWSAYARAGSTWPVQTKRGCVMPCSYCSYPVIEGRRHRMRPAGEVVDEIEQVLRRVGPRTIDFVDSTFNVPGKHAIEICEEILRRGVRATFTTMGINPLHTSSELFGLMKRAGFNSMMVTPESASETMLRNLGKGFSLEDVRRTARLARDAGLHAIWFFMLGGPGETPETVEQTVSFAERELSSNRCLTVFFTGVRVLPGTELARQAFAEGYLVPGTDLARSVFYLSDEVDETWMLDRVNLAIKLRPNIVHAAEEGGTMYERFVHRGLRLMRVAPPYWRFLPLFLGFPPLRALRSRFPTVGSGSGLHPAAPIAE